MKKMIYCFALTYLFFSSSLLASSVKISQPILYTDNGATSYALFNLSWENSWHNQKNHDAVWVFFKFLRDERGYRHCKVESEGHRVTAAPNKSEVDIAFEVPEDRVGLFVYPTENYRGKIEVTLKILLDRKSFERVNTRVSRFTAYAIEMVKIPDGSFMLGDTDPSTVKFGSLYKSDADGKHDGLYALTSEDQKITISPQKGDLYYQSPEGYEGDQKGEIPVAFPKGVDGFYIMKYEPTQGQYANFLNSLSESQSQHRANFGGKTYYEERGSISIEAGKYHATVPNAPCNFMSWDDAMAFADWAGLRPMTEFEFTKAARGTNSPRVGRDFPWGTNSKEALQRMIAENGEFVLFNDWTEGQLSDDKLAVFGASYYWVMDLAGGLWERVVTIGDEKGRNFKGTEGDGNLNSYGFATNTDWPKGIEETGGYGFRGGGFYGYGRDYHDYNPYSPISFRPYGGWSGGNRTNAYGARFVKKGK